MNDISRISDELLSLSPEFYPINLDLPNGLIQFVLMSRRGFKDSSFLDHRSLTLTPIKHTVTLERLWRCLDSCTMRTGPVNFILHGAFCCSTLLARYLELLSGCFVLKEPSLLAQISVLRPNRCFSLESGTQDDSFRDWRRLLDLGLKLLSRVYVPGERVIIKAKDQCNLIGDLLLQRSAESKVVFVQVCLRDFLLSVLRATERRTWVRERLEILMRYTHLFPEGERVKVQSLKDSEAAAYFWLLNDGICAYLKCRARPDQFLTVDGGLVAEMPEEVLRRIAKFFGLQVDESRLRQGLCDSTRTRHSKHPWWEYDLVSRQRELSAADVEFGMEADNGISWAKDYGLHLSRTCT